MASESHDPRASGFAAAPRWRRALAQRFDLLLVNLLLLFVLVPVLHQIGLSTHPLVGRIGASLWFAGIVSAAVLAVSDNRRARVVALGVAVPTILAQVLHFCLSTRSIAWAVIAELSAAVFLGYTLGLLLRYLFRTREVTLNAIWASICGYLLLGLLWASAYQLVLRFSPDAFSGAGVDKAAAGDEPVAEVVFTVYFSFTTLTTLGYGDIVPANTAARMLAVVEAVSGQVYLAVLVARLVGLYVGGFRRRGE